ncbi:MAG: class I SAM-dependent methyltransferase [Dehalococcoidales bacterium]
MDDDPAGWEQAYRRGFADATLEPHEDVAWLDDTFTASGVAGILDLGCGDGRHLAHFARLGYDLTGLDCSPTALRLAAERLGARCQGVRLVLGAMAVLPFADGAFDAVVSFQVLNHGRIADIRRGIAEIGRVLTPGGRLFAVVSIWNESRRPSGIQGIKLEEATYLLPDGHREAGIPHHFFLEDEFRNEFAAFEVERSYRDSIGRACLLVRRPG